MRYIDAAASQQKLRLIGRVVQTNQEYFRLTSARVERGDAAPLEADLFSTELSRVEAEQIVSTGRLESAVSGLKQTVGLSSTDTVMISSDLGIPAPVITLAELQDRAKKDRPDLRTVALL